MRHLGLIELSVANEGLDECLALGVFGEEVLASHTAKAVECPAEHERLHTLAVACREIYALDEVEDVLIWSVLLSFLDDDICCGASHTLDCRDTESYLTMVVG